MSSYLLKFLERENYVNDLIEDEIKIIEGV